MPDPANNTKVEEEHPIASFLESGIQYVETKSRLLQLQAVSQTARFSAGLMAKMVIVLMGSFAFFLLNIGLCYWLGSILGTTWKGFVLIGSAYALLGVLIFTNRKRWFTNPINDWIIHQLLN
jgi:hypothetical protein